MPGLLDHRLYETTISMMILWSHAKYKTPSGPFNMGVYWSGPPVIVLDMIGCSMEVYVQMYTYVFIFETAFFFFTDLNVTGWSKQTQICLYPDTQGSLSKFKIPFVPVLSNSVKDLSTDPLLDILDRGHVREPKPKYTTFRPPSLGLYVYTEYWIPNPNNFCYNISKLGISMYNSIPFSYM